MEEGKETKCYSKIGFVDSRKLSWVEVQMVKCAVDRRIEKKLILDVEPHCLVRLTVIGSAGREI